MDDGTVVIVDSLKELRVGYMMYTLKGMQGKALVLVNDKWHARLNHYDYAGRRDLKGGSEFKAVGKLTVKTGC